MKLKQLCTISLTGAAALMLAACIPPAPEPSPAPSPAPAPPAITMTPQAAPVAPAPAAAPAPPLAENWHEQPRTPGDWSYQAPRSNIADSIAAFSSPGGSLMFRLICTAGGDIAISAASTSTGADDMQIRTETQDRTVPANAADGWITARFAAHDALLDAIAFSRGHFAVSVSGAEPLYPPAYPEITRVIEDCR